MDSVNYNSPDFKRSRGAYVAQCTFEYFISLLVGDVFLAKLLSSIGISDALTGIISSFINVAFIIQIMSIPLANSTLGSKKLVLIFDTISQLLFCGIYFIPFLPFGKEVKTILVMMAIIVAYTSNHLILSICFKWANSYVEPTKRASFSATKEMVSLISGIIFTTSIGFIIDKFESIGNLNGGFLFIGITMLIINICNFVCLMMIKKEEKDTTSCSKVLLKDVLNATLRNKSFTNLIIMSVLWECTRYFSIGFMGIFKTKDLLLSVFVVQIINTVANILRIIVSKPFGRYSDRTSFAKGFELAVTIAMMSFFVSIFITPSTWYLIIIQTILHHVSLAGTNMNSYNIVYSYVDQSYFTQAMSIKNCISVIFGFGASILGGRILNFVQANGNSFLGIHLYGQQLLSAISFVFAVILLIYMKLVIEKQKVKIQ